jgi:hypothetical protein
MARADDLARLSESERNEQQARLVDVGVVAVEDRDARRLAIETLQPVGDKRPAGFPRRELQVCGTQTSPILICDPWRAREV